MKLSQILNEGRNYPVIVVDVQPAYCSSQFANKCQQIIEFVNKQTGPVLMFVNAERDGTTDDSVQEVQQWWEEQAGGYYDEETDEYRSAINWDRFEIADKGYGWFRPWMDAGIDDRVIIATVRLMYQQDVNDSDYLTLPPEEKQTGVERAIVAAQEQMGRDSLLTQWTSVAQLKKFSGAYLVGGARNECLREVELLMNAFNIRYKRIDHLVY